MTGDQSTTFKTEPKYNGTLSSMGEPPMSLIRYLACLSWAWTSHLI